MWNLNDLYTSFDGLYEEDLIHLESTINTYKALVSSRHETDAIEWLVTYLKLEETLTIQVRSLAAYASLQYSANVNDPTPLKYQSKIQTILKKATAENVQVTRYLKTLDLESLATKNELIHTYLYVLKRDQEAANYLLSEQEELLYAKLSELSSDSWRRLQNIQTANLKINVRGETKTLSEVRNMAYDHDASVRKEAYLKELEALELVSDTVSLALTNIKREVQLMNTFRGYQSPLEPTLHSSKMTKATLDALIQTMEDYRPQFEAYLKAKARYLGHQESLPFYDLFAPVGNLTKTYTYDEAKQIVLDAFYSFSKRLGDFAKKAFDNEWIDVEPRPGKVGGAFCSNQPQIKQSRILTNFTGSLSDVLTLAHELGHGFHGDIIQDNLPLEWSYPMPLAETASIFCETIVNQYLLQDIQNPSARLSVLENSLQGDTQVIIDILSRYYFETSVFEKATGPIPTQAMKDMMIDAQKKAYLNGLDHDALHPYMWLMKPHYYSAGLNFYNFPYAFGLLFGKGLYAKYLTSKDSFVSNYETLLSYTTKADVEDVAKTMDIDVTDQAFWKASLELVTQDIFETIKLFEQTKSPK
jgi:pepF/M3 family oligoendopeptidase